jgi:hypothetical protein
VPRRPWNPLELFADHAMAARLWCVVALIAAGVLRVQPFPDHPRLPANGSASSCSTERARFM